MSGASLPPGGARYVGPAHPTLARQVVVGLPPPVAVEPIAGTAFAVAIVPVAPPTSGPAIASLVCGVGSILVSLVVGCFGAIGAQDGWGPMVAGAFAVLAVLAGVAALVLGQVGLNRLRRVTGWERPRGRGLAIGGMICGGSGLALVVLGFLGALLLTVGS